MNKTLFVTRTIAIFCIILAVIPFQAFAAVSVDPLSVDLLTTDQINYKYGSYSGTTPSIAGSGVWPGYTMFSGRSFLQFDWIPANVGKFNKVIFTFYFARGASTSNSDSWGIYNMRYRYNYNNGFTDAMYLGSFGSFNSIDGRYEQWAITDPRGIDCIDIQLFFKSSLYGGCDIVDVTGFRSVGEPVNNVNYYLKSYYKNSSGILIENNTESGPGVSLPRVVDFNDTHLNWYYSTLFIDIPAANRVLKYYDNIVYNVSVIAQYSTVKDSNMNSTDYWIDKVGFSLYEINASNAFISLPVDISCSMNYTPTPAQGSTVSAPEFCLINLTITADVSQYDLSGYTPDLSIQIPPVLGYYDSSETGSSVSLGYIYAVIRSVTLIPPIQEKAWYQVFWGWISNFWTNTTIAIGGFIDNAADRIVAVMSPSEPALPEVEDQLATAASEFHEEMDIIESVTAPSADPDDLIDEVFNIVPLDDPSGNAILTGLVDFEAFVPMAIIVLTFSIVGLVFFGKRD